MTLQVVTVPLNVTSVITRISGPSVETSRRIAFSEAAYHASTTLLSVTTGLVLIMMIKPGVAYAVSKVLTEAEQSFSSGDSLLDLERNTVLNINTFPI